MLQIVGSAHQQRRLEPLLAAGNSGGAVAPHADSLHRDPTGVHIRTRLQIVNQDLADLLRVRGEVQIFKAQRSALAGQIHCQVGHATHHVGARDPQYSGLGHRIRALKRNYGGKLLPRGAIRLSEISVDGLPLITDLHALEWRPRQLPGFVKSLPHLFVGRKHTRPSLRLGPARLPVEV